MNKRHFFTENLLHRKLLLVLVFALLVCNTAGCLASRLAGCLAFAAAAVLYALCQVTCCKCLDSLHGNISFNDIQVNIKIISQTA